MSVVALVKVIPWHKISGSPLLALAHMALQSEKFAALIA